jgi:hypothetical protein
MKGIEIPTWWSGRQALIVAELLQHVVEEIWIEHGEAMNAAETSGIYDPDEIEPEESYELWCPPEVDDLPFK